MSGRADKERASKRIRRLSTDSEDTDGPIDWSEPQRKKAGTGTGTATARAEASSGRKTSEVSRPRRGTASEHSSSAVVSRGPPSSASNSPTSMRLTVKTAPARLREAIRASPSRSTSSNTKISVGSREKLDRGDIIEGKRSRNVRKSYVLESESEDDEVMEDVADNDDAEGESVEEDDEDMDAEGEEDADGDIDMDIPPPPPVITVSKAKPGKTIITARPPPKVDTKTVEQKEIELGSDDEELSELDSDLEEEVEEEEGIQVGDEEDSEGEDEEIEVGDDAEDDENEFDSDDDTPMGGSRANTPDLNKLTKRQRARLEEGGSGHLLALPDEVQVKKHLTAEEHAMRRAEMARRRKNLSEKRNEEEKMETINKLLKKQAPKTNARRGAFNPIAGDSTPDSEQKPDPIFVRWVSNKDGNRIGVPEEWLEGPIGQVFTGDVTHAGGMGGKLIQEVA